MKTSAAKAVNEYHFITNWQVEADIVKVADLLNDAAALRRWWPDVYLDVQVLEPGDAGGVGKLVKLHTRGRLPYTLRWFFRVTESRYPHGFSLDAWGDLTGRGVWTFSQHGTIVDITYDWKVLAEKPILKALSFLLKPLFAYNHRWAMARGQECLRAELARQPSVSAARD